MQQYSIVLELLQGLNIDAPGVQSGNMTAAAESGGKIQANADFTAVQTDSKRLTALTAN